MKATRVEAFSDGVIAILITIMVLELKVPHSPSLEALAELGPVFMSYTLSFAYLGIYWNNHHHLFHTAKKITGRVLWANLILLFFLSLIPFATAWSGENHFASGPMAFYGIIMFLCSIAYFYLQHAIIRAEGPGSVLKAALGSDFKGKLSIPVYLVAAGVAFVQPWISAALYVLMALIWLVPDPRIENALRDDPDAR